MGLCDAIPELPGANAWLHRDMSIHNRIKRHAGFDGRSRQQSCSADQRDKTHHLGLTEKLHPLQQIRSSSLILR